MYKYFEKSMESISLQKIIYVNGNSQIYLTLTAILLEENYNLGNMVNGSLSLGDATTGFVLPTKM